MSPRSRSTTSRRSASDSSCSRSSALHFSPEYSAKKYRDGVIQSGSGAFGNAATRLASFIVKDGAFVYGSYPDIDALFPQQAVELNPKKRAAILAKIQQLVYERAINAPLWQPVS